MEESKIEKIVEFLPKLFKAIAEMRIHYILLSFSFVFVLFSISFNRYFFETFLTFIYAVFFTHIQLARKQEFVDGWKPKGKLFYYIFLHILFVSGSIFWIVEIFKSSPYF